MRKLLLTLSILLCSMVFFAQEISTNLWGIKQVYVLEEGGVLVVSNNISKYNSELQKEWSAKNGINSVFNLDAYSKYFLSKSEEVLFGVKWNTDINGLNLYRLYLTGSVLGDDFATPIPIDQKGWDLFEFFVSESHMNFLLKPNKKSKDGKLELLWVQYDKDLNKVEKKIIIPSPVIKGLQYQKYSFICEKNGVLTFVNNYLIKKNAEEGARTVIVTINPDGMVQENDISEKFPVSAFAQKRSGSTMDVLSYYYLEQTEEIAFQVINEDKSTARLGVMSLDGIVNWERQETFQEKFDARNIVGGIQSFLSVLNDEYLLYNIANPIGGTGHLALVQLEDGSTINTFDYECDNKYRTPSKSYLSSMVNPNGEGKQVVVDIQNSVKKAKKLRTYTMGYITTADIELLWITEGGETRFYKFNIE